jgi:glycosyltransferase involved in cell wall biosynthesis
MKILFVQPYVTYPGVMDDTLPGQLASMGHDVLVATFSRQPLALQSSVSGLRFERVDGISLAIPYFVSEFPYMVNLEDLVKHFEPDIIHANNLPFLTTWQAVRVAKRLRKRSIVHVNGVVMERTYLFNLLQRVFLHAFGPSIFGNADRIICVNNSDAKEITKFQAPPSKIVIIPNAVNVEKFSPSKEREKNTILWAGRFVKQKGLEYLIEAMDILVNKKGMKNVSLLLTGDGPLLLPITAMVKRFGLERNVTFLGRVSRQEIVDRMASCTIYVLPSISEALPTYALLEAMSSGAATIISNIGGSQEIFASSSQPALLVPPRDPTSLADAIERLLKDETLRSQLGKNARDLVLERYDLKITAAAVEQLYRSIL